jgi:hypothetical protein
MHVDVREPFFMYGTVERFCEKISGVLGAWDVVNVDETFVDGVTDEVSTNVDMFHLCM